MKILVGCCTAKNQDEFLETPTAKSVLKNTTREHTDNDYVMFSGEVDAVVKSLNKENIGKHYNSVLELGVKENYDSVLLVHDDIRVEDVNWIKKLKKAHEDNDVVGLAGAKDIRIDEPALWHIMSNPETWSGSVAHPHPEGGTFVTAFGAAPRRCAVLDGLFLSIKVSSITDDIRFDENIPSIAHHYDIDFCLTANKHKLKLTTWPIWSTHESPGLEKQTDEFKTSQKYFLDKWQK